MRLLSIDSVAAAAGEHGLLLAIQDSTGASFAHPVAQALRDEGNPTGFFVHSTLLVATKSRTPVGLVDQQRWVREPKGDKPKDKDRRSYQEKESFKWEAAHERLRARMPSMAEVITVCDREGLGTISGATQRLAAGRANSRGAGVKDAITSQIHRRVVLYD
jgi:hypothetical protein